MVSGGFFHSSDVGSEEEKLFSALSLLFEVWEPLITYSGVFSFIVEAFSFVGRLSYLVALPGWGLNPSAELACCAPEPVIQPSSCLNKWEMFPSWAFSELDSIFAAELCVSLCCCGRKLFRVNNISIIRGLAFVSGWTLMCSSVAVWALMKAKPSSNTSASRSLLPQRKPCFSRIYPDPVFQLTNRKRQWESEPLIRPSEGRTFLHSFRRKRVRIPPWCCSRFLL